VELDNFFFLLGKLGNVIWPQLSWLVKINSSKHHDSIQN